MASESQREGRDPLQQMIIGELRTMRAEHNQRLDEMRRDFSARLDRLVTTEAFAGEQRRVDDRLTDLANDIALERAARTTAIDAERSARKADKVEASVRADKVAANVRWLAAAIVLPIGLFIANIVLARGGA